MVGESKVVASPPFLVWTRGHEILTAVARVDGWESDSPEFARYLNAAFRVGTGGESAGDQIQFAVSSAAEHLQNTAGVPLRAGEE